MTLRTDETWGSAPGRLPQPRSSAFTSRAGAGVLSGRQPPGAGLLLLLVPDSVVPELPRMRELGLVHES